MNWRHDLGLSEVARGKSRAHLAPNAEARAEIARLLGLNALSELTADLSIRPWLDGAEITGRFDGRVEQVCGISLEAFEQPISGQIEVRVVPLGSPNTPIEVNGGEIELDPEAPDPPDVLDGDVIDLAAYLVEHLSLAIDPFPRKPGAVFDYVSDSGEESPFAVLKRLKDKEA